MKLSIIIPTYKESENLKGLIPEITSVLSSAEIPFNISIVDDNSQDGTEELIDGFDMTHVKLIVRKDQKGLSSAVHAGIVQADGDIICFMDADFSHPPKALVGMYEMIKNKEAELVVGSRLVEGGGIDNWPWHRVFTSFVARMMARPLTSITDITSGFFMFSKDVYPKESLNLDGFKIGLEVAVKGNYTISKEYPIIFADRKYGESKLSGKVMIEYIKQLAELYAFKFFKKK